MNVSMLHYTEDLCNNLILSLNFLALFRRHQTYKNKKSKQLSLDSEVMKMHAQLAECDI